MAHPMILRRRNKDAIKRASQAADVLASEHPELAEKAEALKDASGRDQIHEESARLVALADLLDAVVEAVTGRSLEDITDNRDLEDIDGIGPDLAASLHRIGINSPDALRASSDEELLEVDGLGNATLKKIRGDL